jgi:signal transduction histidine kinase
VNFDHLTGELAACLPADKPGTLRQVEAAGHLRLVIRELVSQRGTGANLDAATTILGGAPNLGNAERALLGQRMRDVVERARLGTEGAPGSNGAAPATRSPQGRPSGASRASALPGGLAPITDRAGLGAAGIRSVLQALATKSLELLNADVSQVYLEDGDILSLQAEAPDRHPSLGPQRLTPEEGLASLVRNAGRALALDAEELVEGEERVWLDGGARFVAAVPVGAPGDAGSGLLVAMRVTPKRFTQAEMVEMARLADEVTVAMASADLLSRAEELAVLKERMKLAREIHDGLAADLSAVVQMFKYHEHRRKVDPADADELLVQMRELVQGALQSARDILATLRPRQSAPRKLAESVKQQVETFSRTYGVSGMTRVLGVDTDLVAEEREAIHQVVRESLTNIRKHSQCAAVQVTLDMRQRPFVLVVEDDGLGIDLGAAEEKSGSFGILGMRERAQLLGGTLAIGNGPMGGVRLEFHGPAVPLGS